MAAEHSYIAVVIRNPESFMGLFTADLYRSLAAGFVLGALGLFLVLGSTDDGMVNHAMAAPAPISASGN